jgi:hypothetical protein
MTNSTLPQKLNEEINNYEKHLFGKLPIWNYLLLEQEISLYFNQWHNDVDKVTDLFNRLAGIWQIYFKIGEYSKASNMWNLIIKNVNDWESINKIEIHKGALYYYKGMSTIAEGKLDLGFLLFHQALKEDERTLGQYNTAPAYSFVTFDYTNPNQLAIALLKEKADWLDQYVERYQNSGRGSLSLDDFKNKILKNTNLMESTFSFVHSIFRIHNLIKIPIQIRSSTFSSQLELETIFTLCRCAEEWLKYRQTPNNRYENQLAGQIIRFLKSQKLQFNDADLRNINSIADVNFDSCLNDLLVGNQGSFIRQLQPFEADLMIIYLFRNKAGHSSDSSKFVWENIDNLFEKILFGLFGICEKLF